MILSASAFNSCMIQFFPNTERREVVFRTQWFIGQYCSEREGRRLGPFRKVIPLQIQQRHYWRVVLNKYGIMGINSHQKISENQWKSFKNVRKFEESQKLNF